MTEPRQYTMEEIREKFLRYIWAMIDYWEKEEGGKRHCLEGLAYSILVTLDGESAELPPFAVLPLSSVGDQKYYMAQGENWYPLLQIDNPYDIAGSLHDHLFKSEPKKEEKPMNPTLVITTRQLQDIDWCMKYSESYNHGADGHNRMNTMAAMAKALGFERVDDEVLIPAGVTVNDGPTTGHGAAR